MKAAAAAAAARFDNEQQLVPSSSLAQRKWSHRQSPHFRSVVTTLPIPIATCFQIDPAAINHQYSPCRIFLITDVIQTALHKPSFRKLLRYGRWSNADFNWRNLAIHRAARESCAHWAALHATSTAKGNSQWAAFHFSPAHPLQRPTADGSPYIPPRGEAPSPFYVRSSPLPSISHSASSLSFIHFLLLPFRSSDYVQLDVRLFPCYRSSQMQFLTECLFSLCLSYA